MIFNTAVEFSPSPFPVDEDFLRDFEARAGFKIPSDYRDFLKLHNGPQMRPVDPQIDTLDYALSIDLRTVPGLNGGGSEVKFFEVSFWLDFARIAELYEITSTDWNLPRCVLPIARNSGPAFVYINMSPVSGFGNILLVGDDLISRQENQLEIRVEDFVVVSNSFREFVADLKWISVEAF